MLGFYRCFICKRLKYKSRIRHWEDPDAVKHCVSQRCNERCAVCHVGEREGQQNVSSPG